MKRALFGLVWFVVFSVVGLGALGAVAGFVAAYAINASDYAAGVRAGDAAGRQVGAKYGGFVILGALALAVIGTAARVLPGTKGRRIS